MSRKPRTSSMRAHLSVRLEDEVMEWLNAQATGRVGRERALERSGVLVPRVSDTASPFINVRVQEGTDANSDDSVASGILL